MHLGRPLARAARPPVLHRLPRVVAAAQVIAGPSAEDLAPRLASRLAATPPDGGRAQDADRHDACHRAPRPPPPPRASRTANLRRATPAPAPRRVRAAYLPGHAATGTPVTSAPRLRTLNGAARTRPRPVPRTAPGTPVSLPGPGSGESDWYGGKAPSGAGDYVSWLRLRMPELWSIPRRREAEAGRYAAGRPSFSPD